MDADTLEQVNRHFHVATEALRSDFRALAEAVAARGDDFRREVPTVRTEIEEVKAMIRWSCAEIDRRLRFGAPARG
jgi:hypothetical protein